MCHWPHGAWSLHVRGQSRLCLSHRAPGCGCTCNRSEGLTPQGLVSTVCGRFRLCSSHRVPGCTCSRSQGLAPRGLVSTCVWPVQALLVTPGAWVWVHLQQVPGAGPRLPDASHGAVVGSQSLRFRGRHWDPAASPAPRCVCPRACMPVPAAPVPGVRGLCVPDSRLCLPQASRSSTTALPGS